MHFTNLTVPGTLHGVDTAKGYTSLITADSVMKPFPLRWKLLSSAPLGRDVLADGVCSQCTANIRCQVLGKPPDYIGLSDDWIPALKAILFQTEIKRKMKGRVILTFLLLIPTFPRIVGKIIFLDLFINEPEDPKGFISYHLVKAGWRGTQ